MNARIAMPFISTVFFSAAETIKSRNCIRMVSEWGALNLYCCSIEWQAKQKKTIGLTLWWREAKCIIASTPLCARRRNGMVSAESAWQKHRMRIAKWKLLKVMSVLIACYSSTRWNDEWIKLNFDSEKCIIRLFVCDSMGNLLCSVFSCKFTSYSLRGCIVFMEAGYVRTLEGALT